MRQRLLRILVAGCATVLLVGLVGCTSSTSVDAAGTESAPSGLGSPPRSVRPSRSPTRPSHPGHSHHPDHSHRPHHHSPSQGHHPRVRGGVPAADMPDLRLTPGVALSVSAARVCVPGYASSVRDVPDSEKAAVYARYGVAWVPYKHEIDHLISLELGGSNSIRNLWPEPYAGRWGARTKDALENRLHDLVCSGQLSLREAQRREARNWVAAYRRYIGSPMSGSGGGTPTSAGGFYASSYPTASTIYCAGDSAWRQLSRTYLVHFATWAAAHRRFPRYHLHQPC